MNPWAHPAFGRPTRSGGLCPHRGRFARFVGWGLAFMLLAAVATVSPVLPQATCDPTDEAPAAAEAEDLFSELLKGRSPGEWRGVLNRILEEQDGTWIGEVLGTLFRDSVDHADTAAYVAAYLADRPLNEKVYLGSAIVRRAHGDPDFLAAMRSHITKGEGGWARLIGYASELLAGDDVQGRRAAVFFLSHEDGEQREEVRRQLLAQAAADAPTLQTADGARAGLAVEYLDAFDRFLGTRFTSVQEAVKTLEPLKGLDLAQVILELSKRKSLPSAPDRQRLVNYGMRLVDAVVARGDTDALGEFLQPALTPHVELRRYAMQKAGQMDSVANAAWGNIIQASVESEQDPEVLRGALTLLERTGFAEASEVAPLLSAALCVRLEAHGPGATDGRDALADRVRMAKLVGSLKARSNELKSVLSKGDRLEGEVLGELVRALGGVDDVSVEEVLLHYRQSTGDVERDRLVRVAAVDALGRGGFRPPKEQSGDAASALCEILVGKNPPKLGRSEDEVVRRHAIRSLGIHPSKETAIALHKTASSEEEQEARVAIVVLRKAASSDTHAVQALGAIAQDEALSVERRVSALEALGALASADDRPRTLARESARTVLGSKAPDQVRLEAAAACANLSDALALEPMLAWWQESADEDRWSALRALLLAAAKAGSGNDAVVSATLVAIGGVSREDACDLAARLSAEIVELTERSTLKFARAQILFTCASAPNGALDDRLEKLALSAELLGQLATGPDAEAPPAVGGLQVRVVRLQGDLAVEDAAKKGLYLDAVRRSTTSKDPAIVRLGLETVDLLLTEPLKALLNEADTVRIEEDRKILQARLGS